MDLDDYFLAVREYAELARQRRCPAHELLDACKGSDPRADACAVFRELMLVAGDIHALAGFLEIGFFLDPSPKMRMAWYAFAIDVARIVQNHATEAECERYAASQMLFSSVPKLFDAIRKRTDQSGPDYELIDERAVSCIGDTEVYSVEGKFTKLAPHLSPRIPAWARHAYPEAPRFVRLDANQVYDQKPAIQLLEAAIVPADPSWLSKLALHPRTKTFASYALSPSEPDVGSLGYWDYHVLDIRRLEMTATRRKTDYLSMMIEELPREDSASGLMIGRCIHLDTTAKHGTPLANARLQHLDLAINVYRDDTRNTRFGQTLQGGKVVDATYRTHLYRIEDIPMAALFVFAGLFLESKFLLSEWMSDILSRVEQ